MALVTSFMKASIVKSSNLAAYFKVTFLSYLFTMGNDCFTCKVAMFVIVFIFVFFTSMPLPILKAIHARSCSCVHSCLRSFDRSYVIFVNIMIFSFLDIFSGIHSSREQ